MSLEFLILGEKFKMGFEYDVCGWATKNDLLCSDGRTIRKGAFAAQDGMVVPLLWNHDHKDPGKVLGHALLENRDEGVYTYASFNDTKNGQNAKELCAHGDICAFSIWANQLKQNGGDVVHGKIIEVSLVYAGANPGASIDSVIKHSEDGTEEGWIYTGEDFKFGHGELKETESDSSDRTVEDVFNTMNEKQKNCAYYLIGRAKAIKDGKAEDANANIEHADSADTMDESETIEDIIETFNEEQATTVAAIISDILGETVIEANDDEEKIKHSEGDDITMNSNAFDQSTMMDSNEGVLTHADQIEILKMAQRSDCGSLRAAIDRYCASQDHLSHGINEIETLFPEYKNLGPTPPEMITSDQTWISGVMNGVTKSPISRIRTRQMDVKSAGMRARGYKKGNLKKETVNVSMLKRTTDPQTVYIKDSVHRDDIIDVTDFDVVDYMWKLMRMTMNEEIATAILIGDGRDASDDDKISEDHIRSIMNDDELYTIHHEVDFAAAKAKLQGTDTSKHFGDDYVYAEAMVEACLFTRENYKGSGSVTLFCEPHFVNQMLLARDMNGRRIYSNLADLTSALNVSKIETVEQFAGVVRTDKEGKNHDLIGIMVNLKDYQVGSTKGGEITQFNQFDIDYNKEKLLIETRLSGALTRIKSAIVLEKPETT